MLSIISEVNMQMTSVVNAIVWLFQYLFQPFSLVFSIVEARKQKCSTLNLSLT